MFDNKNVKLKDYNKEIAIIDHTLDIVFETGIAGVKMSKLAKRVGISPSTLYVYFETKEDLINSIGLKIISEIDESLETALSAADTFEQKFRAKWFNMLQFHLNHEKELNFIEQWRQSPFFSENSKKIFNSKGNSKSMLFQSGRDQNLIKNLDDHIIHAILSGMAKQFVGLIKMGALTLDQTSMDLTFSIVWDAVKQ